VLCSSQDHLGTGTRDLDHPISCQCKKTPTVSLWREWHGREGSSLFCGARAVTEKMLPWQTDVKLHEADADMENSVIEAKQCNGAKWEQLCADADDNGR
jgi:hypothetical protein